MVEGSGFRRPRRSGGRKRIRKRPLASSPRDSGGTGAVEDTELFNGRGVELVYKSNGRRLVSWTGHVQDKQDHERIKRLALYRGTMRPSLRLFWRSLHVPRVVTFVTMLCYATLFLYGTYCIFHPSLYLGVFWLISAVLLTVFPPISFIAAWRGWWQIERPLIFPVVAGIIVNTIVSAYVTFPSGLWFGHVVVLSLTAQAFVARWVRIKTSYESPARIAGKYKKSLDNRND